MRRPATILGLLRMLWRTRRRSGRDAGTASRRSALAVTLVSVALVWLGFGVVASGSSSEVASVDDVLSASWRLRGSRARVYGELCGSIERSASTPCVYRFSLTSARGVAALPVLAPTCVLPDAMTAPGGDLSVLVEGELGTDGVFIATRVLARCPSKYDAEREQRPRRACPSR
jgi:cytochrome c-type biogenesis protein CcmE